jgi:hypothetical protein
MERRLSRCKRLDQEALLPYWFPTGSLLVPYWLRQTWNVVTWRGSAERLAAGAGAGPINTTAAGGPPLMNGPDRMNSLAQTPSAPVSQPQRDRFTGWAAIASGVALIIVGQKAYFPPSWSLVLLLGTLALYLGMLPAIRWIAQGLAARNRGEAVRVMRMAEIAGLTGAGVAAVTALLALPHWLPAVPAQILDTSALGVIGLWLLVANALAFRLRLFNRALAALGVLAGLSWLLAALIMWAELLTSARGSHVPALENLRLLAGYVGAACYLIWALWLGIWLLLRKR